MAPGTRVPQSIGQDRGGRHKSSSAAAATEATPENIAISRQRCNTTTATTTITTTSTIIVSINTTTITTSTAPVNDYERWEPEHRPECKTTGQVDCSLPVSIQADVSAPVAPPASSPALEFESTATPRAHRVGVRQRAGQQETNIFHVAMACPFAAQGPFGLSRCMHSLSRMCAMLTYFQVPLPLCMACIDSSRSSASSAASPKVDWIKFRSKISRLVYDI